MSARKSLPVKELQLDQNNHRVPAQKNETNAIKALLEVNPGKFWALMKSLINDGYHPVENIVVLKDGSKNIVKEGNRRIAALKIILGYTKIKKSDLASDINERIQNLTAEWKRENKNVPCIVYKSSEISAVAKIVGLTHATNEPAAREHWNSLARVRYNKYSKGHLDPALDLLEKYLEKGQNLSTEQRTRLGGNYPITVLVELNPKIALAIGLDSPDELVKKYPRVKYRDKIESLLKEIGLKTIGFSDIRAPNYIYSQLGIRHRKEETSSSAVSKTTKKPTKKSKTGASTEQNLESTSIRDPNSIKKQLKSFRPIGKGREKLVALLDEAKTLDITKHPHSFCFLLRSIFELSAKAYLVDHNIPITKKNNEKKLVTLLKEATNHLTKNRKDLNQTKKIYGALTELSKPEGLLSVTSFNQLIHNPNFSIRSSDLSVLFGNIFPLLKALSE